MTTYQSAEKYFKIFSKAEGNQHIASLFAIKKLLDIIRDSRPENILEVGLGIGSIAYSIADFMNLNKLPFRYFGTEENDFCLGQLPINLQERYKQIHIFNDIESIQNAPKFDLVIVDGSDAALESIKGNIAEHGIIYIEGDRATQVTSMQRLFPQHKYVHTVSSIKEPAYSPFIGKWSGGGKLIFVNPTFGQKLFYLSEKIKTALNYRLREFKK